MQPQNQPRPVMDVSAPPRPPAVVPAGPPAGPVPAAVPTPAPVAPEPAVPMTDFKPAMQPLPVQPLPRDPATQAMEASMGLEESAKPAAEKSAVHKPEKAVKTSTTPVGIIVATTFVMLLLMGLAIVVYVMSSDQV